MVAPESTMDRESLVQAILDLAEGRAVPLSDEAMAQTLAEHVRPYIERLIALRQTDASTSPPPGEEVTIDDLADAASTSDMEPVQVTQVPSRETSVPAPTAIPTLTEVSPEERAKWIFMDRFVTLDHLQELLGYELTPEDRELHNHNLSTGLQRLLALSSTLPLLRRNDVPALQRLFASSVLFLRNPFQSDEHGHVVPCTLEALRLHFEEFFYKRRKTPNWYERYGFYTETMGRAHWVVADFEYLNCTLFSPQRKLARYARRWGAPVEYVPQKTVLEDVYDRVICGRAFDEDLFEQNCSSCTATTYQPQGRGPERLVYTVQRARKIAIHGKPGIPHWRTSRRLWPAVFPSLVLSLPDVET